MILKEKYQQTKGSVNEGGRDRRATKKGLVALTRARGQLDNAVQKEFGVQMQRRYRARLLKKQSVQAQTRESLGIRPEYGAPVLMPPSDRLSGALSIASQVIGIVSGISGLGLGSASAGAGLTSSSASSIAGGLGSSGLLSAPVFPGGFIDPFAGIG